MSNGLSTWLHVIIAVAVAAFPLGKTHWTVSFVSPDWDANKVTLEGELFLSNLTIAGLLHWNSSSELTAAPIVPSPNSYWTVRR